MRSIQARRKEPPQKGAAPESSLVLRGHFRTRGEIGPFLLRRSWDADGEPMGYERFTPDRALLDHAQQEAVFDRLPDETTNV